VYQAIAQYHRNQPLNLPVDLGNLEPMLRHSRPLATAATGT
jgi:hypothetical protein